VKTPRIRSDLSPSYIKKVNPWERNPLGFYTTLQNQSFGSEAKPGVPGQHTIAHSQHLENVNVDLCEAKSYRGVSQNTERQRPPFAFQQET
jgi:hypothetical protein